MSGPKHPTTCAEHHGGLCECGDDVREHALRDDTEGNWKFIVGIAIAIGGPLLVALLLWLATR